LERLAHLRRARPPAPPNATAADVSDARWSEPGTVAGFASSPPNATLLRFADAEWRRHAGRARLVDIGCGAGRNAVPLARLGWDVCGVDRFMPMLEAAAARKADRQASGRLQFVRGAMDRLPLQPGAFDLVVAHGIWNLARTTAEFRESVREAARVSAPGAALFVFTFSRNTLAADAQPVAGEAFVFTQFSGEPQCFLTEGQLRQELGDAGFVPDPGVPMAEHNRPLAGGRLLQSTPVIYEAAFRYER
jgi:SAM-dependent methyltransferase